MNNANDWKIERWEDQDYIITGFGLQHPSVFTKKEAELILSILKLATPLIQEDASSFWGKKW